MQEQKEVHRRRMIWKTGSFEMIKNEKESNATKKNYIILSKKKQNCSRNATKTGDMNLEMKLNTDTRIKNKSQRNQSTLRQL